ncbi:hypothetical protein ETD86_30225 [Nonomuraea turkmeniaca]|uniref:Uncharacterized protein n=1 Tax=Nonomuraea turkmeniaca TaxID=103838 RepID=A0A5S4F9N2_9ACTN|nr:hypothetical protein [Nonomuraea turkmeniaca]TMR13718.1 hypothetical protein ETD86_30225 [Nonomuraea turkmeniaca]
MKSGTRTERPRGVVLAATLQLLSALPFVLGTYVVLVHGAGAQAAAEAEVARQGVPPSVLAEHGISFGSNVADLPFAIAIVLILATLAVLNLNGRRVGRILSWTFHPILFVAGVVIVPGQVWVAPLLESMFASDPVLARVNVTALVDAAAQAMPGWLHYAAVVKLVLTTLGSVLVVVLLALPPARAYFRGKAL